MLFPDFLQRFLPRPIDGWDRARWLEGAIEGAYAKGVVDSGFLENATASRLPFARSFLDHWSPEQFPHTPALVMNTTEVTSGKRLLISPFSFPATGVNFLPRDTVNPPLSTAAGLSARFPWVTPSAYFHRQDAERRGKMQKVRIVDGGYFENSGVASALDLIKAMVKAAKREGITQQLEINLLVFTSLRFEQQGTFGLGELVDPIRTMLSTRSARAGIAVDEAFEALNGMSNSSTDVSGKIIRLELNGYGYPLPLGWRLSPVTRHLISFQNGSEEGCETSGTPVSATVAGLSASCAKELIYNHLR